MEVWNVCKYQITMWVKGTNIVFQVSYTSNSKLRKKISDLWLPETGVDREGRLWGRTESDTTEAT